MLRVIIIDDEFNGVRSLEILLQKFSDEVKVIATSTSAIEGAELINNYHPDLVFLDINMPHLNGFQLLDKLSFRDFRLVFTTAHCEYALQALKEGATDYLLKPVGRQDLRETIDRVKKRTLEERQAPDLAGVLGEMTQKQNSRIAVPSKDRVEYVLVSDIVYIEADSNATQVFTVNSAQCIPATRSLKEYESLLCTGDSPFIRIHNSYIINADYATRYSREGGGYVVMQDKKSIPVSKNKKEEFLRMINLGNRG